MKKKLYTVFCLIILLAFSSCQQNTPVPAYTPVVTSTKYIIKNTPFKSTQSMLTVDQKKINSTLKKLSSSPRVSGTKGEDQAISYIKSSVEKFGYVTTIQKFPLYDAGDLRENFWRVDPEPNAVTGYGKNIMFSTGSKQKDSKLLIISAHLDSVEKSPGANDNASGVAVVLEVARLLKNKNTNMEVRFILFGGEESGLIGSRYYVAKMPLDERSRMVANINVDVAGVIGTSTPKLYTDLGKENAASAILQNNPSDIKINLCRPTFGTSDFFAFASAGYNAVTIGEFLKDHYIHTAQDTAENIDPDKVYWVAKLVYSAVFHYVTQ